MHPVASIWTPKKFLSTPSARRATLYFFSQAVNRQISIHALREEGDSTRATSFRCIWIFLSTPSARRATLADYLGLPTKVISIHALREEGD